MVNLNQEVLDRFDEIQVKVARCRNALQHCLDADIDASALTENVESAAEAIEELDRFLTETLSEIEDPDGDEESSE